MNNAFDERCKNDPQGVIKDLLAQITRQVKEIHDRGVTITERDDEIKQLNKKIAKLDKSVTPVVEVAVVANDRDKEIPFDPD